MLFNLGNCQSEVNTRGCARKQGYIGWNSLQGTALSFLALSVTFTLGIMDLYCAMPERHVNADRVIGVHAMFRTTSRGMELSKPHNLNE